MKLFLLLLLLEIERELVKLTLVELCHLSVYFVVMANLVEYIFVMSWSI